MQMITLGFQMNKPKITKKEIEKVVRITQALEGYEPATKAVKEETKKLREKYDIKVSQEKGYK